MNRSQCNSSIAVTAVLFLVAVLFPVVVVDNYKLGIATTLLRNILLVMSLRPVMNLGLMNMAHISLSGIGAYTSAALAMHLGVSFWIALPCAALVAGAFAFAVGAITLRVQGPYFFLLTFALLSMVTLFFGSFYEDIFGGATGLIGVPRPDPIEIGSWKLELVAPVSLYYLMLALLTLSMLILGRLETSHLGMSCEATRQSEVLARSLGIRTTQCKLFVLALSGLLAGVAGVFFAHSRGVVNASDFGVEPMLWLLVFLVVGGVGSFWGPVFGTVALTILSEFLRELHSLETLVYGAALICVIRFFPKGISEEVREVFDVIRRKVRA
jgi:branched-chain amino acid transport system permease protein